MADSISIKAPEGTCACGCGEATTAKRSYRQGHDARLRGLLGKAYRAGQSVIYNGKTSSAEAALREHGFPIPPERKPVTRKAKTTAKRSTAKGTKAKATRKRKTTTRRRKTTTAA